MMGRSRRWRARRNHGQCPHPQRGLWDAGASDQAALSQELWDKRRDCWDLPGEVCSEEPRTRQELKTEECVQLTEMGMQPTHPTLGEGVWTID